jgi:hypothetical protein
MGEIPASEVPMARRGVAGVNVGLPVGRIEAPISAMLRWYCKFGDWTTPQLVAATGLDRRVLERFMAGQRDITIRSADRLARAMRLELAAPPLENSP